MSERVSTAWDRLARHNAATARRLRLDDDGGLRSLVSRVYYAAYSRITFRLLEAGAGPFGDRENPPHRVLPQLVRNRLASLLGVTARVDWSQAIRRLRTRREVADYQPRILVDRALAREALRDLVLVERLLGDAR